MNFSNIAVGNPFYILRRAEKPTLEIGVVKSKVDKQPYQQQQTSIPIAFPNVNQPQNVSIVVEVNGKEVQIPDVPSNIEIANDNRDGCMYSGSREAMLQAVDGMIQASKKALDEVEYHKNVLTEGDKMLEILNPQYAEDKRQAKRIQALEDGMADIKSLLQTALTAISAKNEKSK